jgi:hypothetical protein
MAQSSFGWRGTVTEVQWSQLAALMGQGNGLATPSDCRVTQVAGTRAVSVAAGSIFGDGVLTALSSAETVALPTPTNGQWFLLVLNRVWATKATSLLLRNGPTTATATSGNVPTTYPASKTSGVGSNSDVPIAWLWGNSTATAVTVVPIITAPPSVQPRTGTAAQRDALYGAPSSSAAQNSLQGARWHNTDLGWTEVYTGAYDATTNPSGTAGSAGWYPVPGALRASQGRSAVTVQIGSAFSNLNDASWWSEIERVGFDPFSDGWTVPVSGDYRIDAALSVDTYACYMGVTSDGSAPTVDSFVLQSPGPLVAQIGMAQATKVVPLTKGNRIRIAALAVVPSGITPIATGRQRSWFNIEWVGPSRKVV